MYCSWIIQTSFFSCDEALACHVNGKVCDPSFSGTCFLFAISLYSFEIPNAASTKRRSNLKNFRNLNVTVFRFSRV